MSSGKTHNWANAWLGGVAIALAFHQQLPFWTGASLAAGCLFGGAYLSCDLDLPHSIPSKRWGKLRSLWNPYRRLVGRHRSWLSHSPILSTFLRVVYLLGLIGVAIAPFYLLLHEKIPVELAAQARLWLDREGVYQSLFAFYLGLELSTDLHLLLDWGYSTRKKLKRLKM